MAAVEEVIGLFVADWTQSLTTVAILALGWLALPRLHVNGVAFVLALALGLQLVVATLAEARRKARSSANH
jgi:ABC-type nickel/cobalt efflux system permease component RcnA